MFWDAKNTRRQFQPTKPSFPLRTVLVTAYAKAPKGTAMYEVFQHAGIVLEVDIETDIIVDAEFTFITDLAKDYLRRLLAGHRLTPEADDLPTLIACHYMAPSQQAVVVALKIACQRYFDSKAIHQAAGSNA